MLTKMVSWLIVEIRCPTKSRPLATDANRKGEGFGLPLFLRTDRNRVRRFLSSSRLRIAVRPWHACHVLQNFRFFPADASRVEFERQRELPPPHPRVN